MTVETDRLRWFTECGYGYLPSDGTELYDLAYWAKYHEYKGSPIAEQLMAARVALVEKHAPEARVVDIGIGSGHFIEKRESTLHPTREPFTAAFQSSTYGYDVNPHAISWLVDRKIWWDPWAQDPAAVTFWDSFEHLPRPHDLVARVRSMLFVSIPIFRDREHAVSSKHFKPGEHLWYFTRQGFIRHLERLGFKLIDENQMESDLGREEIGTFVFKRKT